MPNKVQRYTVYFIWKLLYMFRGVLPPIIRSANNCIYSIWYLSHRYYYLPLPPIIRSANNCICSIWYLSHCYCYLPLYAADTVVCAPDDGWWYYPKHVEQVPDKINCVNLLLFGDILEYSYDARTHER
jgi:hypothetical protein